MNGDGVTPNDLPDLDGIQNYPEILSAEWDPEAKRGLVTMQIPGYVQPEFPKWVGVRLFRSGEPDALGFGDSEKELSGYVDEGRIPADGRLTMTVFEDVTGLWLTAHAYRFEHPLSDLPHRYESTSEFGPAFRAREPQGR